MQRQFIKRQVEKTYVAEVTGEVKANEGSIDLPLAPDYFDLLRQMVCYENGSHRKQNGKDR